MNLTEAVDEAIDRCIAENVLKELLVKCRGEVRNMVLSTFNRELYEKDLKAEGKEQGQKELNILYKKLLDAGRLEEIEKAIQDEEYLEKLWKEFAEEDV